MRKVTVLDIAISEDFRLAGVPAALACIQADVTVNEGSTPLGHALRLEAELRVEALEDGNVSGIPVIAAARKAYRALGKDPARYRVSAETLMRRLAQGKALYRINTVVDTNNLISLHTGLSIGTYDAAALTPPITLRTGRPGESYEAIGRGPFNLENLPLLADQQGPFGSPTSDSERSMITLGTRNILMVLFSFGREAHLPRAVEFATDCLESYCAARDIETAMIGEDSTA